MQISLKWINEIVDIKEIKLDSLIEKLTLGGFEVEEILEFEIEHKPQIALDISATANRSDSLSIQGISTEIAALLNKPVNISNYSFKSNNPHQLGLDYSRNFENYNDCSIFSFMVVENLTNLTVPKWITQKLLSSGFTPSNDLLDFQNYILLETGYPFLFYDFEKICSELNTSNFDLSISNAAKGEKFLASDDQIYELNDSISIVKANGLSISVAGIIENQKFAYSKNTISLLIEGSVFNAAKIRQQSRILGVRTDRSTRYEKSLKNTYLMESFYRLISLLRISNPKLTCRLQSIQKQVEETVPEILLRYQKLNEILGPIENLSNGNFEYISLNKVENYLTRLNFKFSYSEKTESWRVKIPDVRNEDLKREIDLIEEIGRLHGFNNFLITLPKLKNVGREDRSYKVRKKITSSLLNFGFNELIHYSLVNENPIEEKKIKLINPLSSDYASLRVSLLPSLIKTIEENLKQGNPIINGFEYGHIFFSTTNGKFEEKEYIGGILGGQKTKLTWSEPETELTWFEAKGQLEQLFEQLNFSVNWVNKLEKNSQNKIIHPYRHAELYLSNGSKLGQFGQLNPILANQLNILSQIYLFELDMEIIQNQFQSNQLPFYKEYSFYPKIVKDISFIISYDIDFTEIQETLYYNGTNILTEINLLDEYKGESIPDQFTSLCCQLVFQSNKKTLENKKIEKIMENLRSVLITKFQAIIRS